jgi:hyaluronan synthase
VVDWKENRGKREGMAEGVKMARGELVVFIDSDSFIKKDCIRHLVKYFKDPQIGAVSGHTDVYNSSYNMMTRMQAVRYYISFRIYKAAESVFGLVTCCPGCCSAYRREYLNEFIDEWLDQKFLGKKCTFGDDRSLTNFMLRKYKTVYSTEARAETVVPDNFKKYLKQQQRWKKSWVRETLIASSFMWRKSFFAAFFFYTYVFLAMVAPVVFFRAVIWYPIQHGTWPFVYLIGLFSMLLLHGIYYRIEVGDKKWFLAIVAFWFNTVVLIWQLPWAMVTVSDNKWGTR